MLKYNSDPPPVFLGIIDYIWINMTSASFLFTLGGSGISQAVAEADTPSHSDMRSRWKWRRRRRTHQKTSRARQLQHTALHLPPPPSHSTAPTQSQISVKKRSRPSFAILHLLLIHIFLIAGFQERIYSFRPFTFFDISGILTGSILFTNQL